MNHMEKELNNWLGGKSAFCSDEQFDAFEAGWLAATKIAVEFCLAKKGYGTSDECAASIMSLRTEVLTEPSVVRSMVEEGKKAPKELTIRGAN